MFCQKLDIFRLYLLREEQDHYYYYVYEAATIFEGRQAMQTFYKAYISLYVKGDRGGGGERERESNIFLTCGAHTLKYLLFQIQGRKQLWIDQETHNEAGSL